ncbi:hypothetical protein [Legionella hackeliae]|uniref:Uncharacterized protein n=1 Tax=Legionella hackeliae TaxID=449 RepID=A0A0A8UQ49_LEGHA|nr:hypothetical protein [Legionella hackeliae]KTD09785.1 hypothetical protein Lhac_2153 [Legionella hackeliae]CEK10888.1 conserved protein of unknown function [Legionella hackeliae]STX47625.1 Uncharacterised protein [Legionella hackeliae]
MVSRSVSGIDHITGSKKVVANRITHDIVEPQKRRSVGQMFFQPYESSKEFIFCARHTFMPAALIGLAILDPVGVAIAPIIITGLAAGFLLVGSLAACAGWESASTDCFDHACNLINSMCQAIINMVVLPLSALVMLTRGISTGLQAAGIYDYDAPPITGKVMHV